MVAKKFRFKKQGENKTIWRGEVVEGLTFSHDFKDRKTGEVTDKAYRIGLKVETKTNKGRVLDVSVLPILVTQQQLDKLEKSLEVGDILFIRGSWRAYTLTSEQGKRRVEQYGIAEELLHTELKDDKSLNRYEFEGYLVSKLFVPEKDENGKPKRGEDGNFVYLLDEEGNKIPTVRTNKEKKIVNDYQVAINMKGRSYYIPSLSYYDLAKKVAFEIPVGARVKGAGYIRSRFVEETNKTVYEAVVVSISVLEEKKAEDSVVNLVEVVEVKETTED